jgi:glycosyltransferase involved in cell wall biosynthesis
MMAISLMGEGIYGARLRAAGVEVIALGMKSPLSTPRVFWSLCRIMRQRKPDVVQTWMYHADLIGGLAGRLLGVPVCWGIRLANLENGTKRSTKFVALICGWLSAWVPDHAISCSEGAIQSHRNYGYRVPIKVVPNGYNISEWKAASEHPLKRHDLGLSERDVVVIHAARAHPQKDHANLARAFSAAYERNDDLRLLLCGPGLEAESDYVRSLPFSPEARKAVRALGPRDDLPRLWRAADFFVLSSIVEGFPNVVAEAMAGGLPAIVTDVGDAALIVGNTGNVVPPADSPALTTAILRMAAMPREERQQLGLKAAKRVEENYTIDRMVAGFMSVWCSILRVRRA